jgi:hypothetical protein
MWLSYGLLTDNVGNRGYSVSVKSQGVSKQWSWNDMQRSNRGLIWGTWCKLLVSATPHTLTPTGKDSPASTGWFYSQSGPTRNQNSNPQFVHPHNLIVTEALAQISIQWIKIFFNIYTNKALNGTDYLQNRTSPLQVFFLHCSPVAAH